MFETKSWNAPRTRSWCRKALPRVKKAVKLCVCASLVAFVLDTVLGFALGESYYNALSRKQATLVSATVQPDQSSLALPVKLFKVTFTHPGSAKTTRTTATDKRKEGLKEKGEDDGNKGKGEGNDSEYKYVIYKPESEKEKDYYRLEHSSPINSLDFIFSMSPKDLCLEPLMLMVLVKSSPENQVARKVVRDSWGGLAVGKEWPEWDVEEKMNIAFVIGRDINFEQKYSLTDEQNKYNDLIQGEFPDSKAKITEKALFALKWVLGECQRAQYIVITSDDTFLNVPHLVHTLKAWERNSEFRSAAMGPFQSQVRVHRGPGFNGVSSQAYPFSIYPPYEAGSAYVITADVIESLVQAASFLPIIPVEGAYVTGILGAAVGLKHAQQTGFDHQVRSIPPILTCQIVNNEIISKGPVSPADMAMVWKKMTLGAYNCM